jgi:hypothetical protein
MGKTPVHHDQNPNPKWIRYVHIVTSYMWLVHDPITSSSRCPYLFLWISSSLCYFSLLSDAHSYSSPILNCFIDCCAFPQNILCQQHPLKYFNCGGIGHFASKFPHRNKYSDEKEDSKRENKYQKGNKRRNKLFKKSFYSKEDSSSSEEKYNDSDNDSKRVLFMEVENDSKEEGEVDLRAELISALK